MRVLIVRNASTKEESVFVWTLSQALHDINVNVTCSVPELWNNWYQYDIIHFMWPDSILKGGHTLADVQDLLAKIREKNIRTIATVHNLRPHYCSSKSRIECYNLVYQNCEYFVHMAKFSCELFKTIYPDARHIIIPHHLYSRIYTPLDRTDNVYNKLHLRKRYKYILCLGSFRSNEERLMIKELSTTISPDGYKIIAPSYFPIRSSRERSRIIRAVKFILHKILEPSIIFYAHGFVPFCDVPFYYAVSDIALIQRKVILNSGNLPLALLFGKVVVGPDVGNVGEILKESSNPSFNPDEPSSLVEAVKKAIKLNNEGMGRQNYDYAKNNFSPEMIAQQYKQLYESRLHQ